MGDQVSGRRKLVTVQKRTTTIIEMKFEKRKINENWRTLIKDTFISGSDPGVISYH